MSSISLTFEAFTEASPGPLWQALFERHWPRYRDWFLSEGEAARTTYAESIRALGTHMPELVETYVQICELAGGGDLEARFLAMFAPPSYLSGCSQAVWRGPQTGGPVLIRNYDYAPERLEGAIVSTAWAGKRVLGVSDCAWGLLDGVNEDGLAVSLAFGGRKVVGPGFGIPLVVRYLLQTCATTEQARTALLRLPYHLAHTLTMVDANGDTCTAYIAPDRDVVLTEAPVATNHQGRIEWAEHARATRSLEREGTLLDLVTLPAAYDDLTTAFLVPPLYQDGYARRMGTLYTVAYDVRAGAAAFLWPGQRWDLGFARFEPGSRTVTLESPAAA
ncbi:MAG: C45 family peptidase [Gaiellales bacterium]